MAPKALERALERCRDTFPQDCRNPKLLILDEATEGLAPLVRKEIWSCIKRLKNDGQAILVVDKNLDALMKLADRHVVIEKGYVVWTGESSELAADPSVRERFLQA